MPKILPALGLALLNLALPIAASAQPAAAAPVTPVATTIKPDTPSAAPAGFQSAFDGYRAYSNEKAASWKEANDTAGRIGGWREYAKQAQQPESAEALSPAKP